MFFYFKKVFFVLTDFDILRDDDDKCSERLDPKDHFEQLLPDVFFIPKISIWVYLHTKITTTCITNLQQLAYKIYNNLHTKFTKKLHTKSDFLNCTNTTKTTFKNILLRGAIVIATASGNKQSEFKPGPYPTTFEFTTTTPALS
jgi:hypothetical protein